MNKQWTTVICIGMLSSSLHAQVQRDITFDEYLHQVGKHNLEYMATCIDADIATAEVVAAKVLPDPSLDFEAGSDHFSLGLSYDVEIGKRHARVQVARAEQQWQQIALEGAFQDLRSKAADLFLEAILQRRLLDVSYDSYTYMDQFRQSDSLRYLSGEIAENDARQSRLETISLLNDVYEQEAAYHSAVVELNQFMGIDTDTLLTPVGNWEELERDFTLSQLLDSALLIRPEVRMAHKYTEVSRKNHRLVRAERIPDIGLSLSYERDWGHFLPQMRCATLGVSLPLAFSAINKGELKSARLKTEQADLSSQHTELSVATEVRQAWYAFQASRKKVTQYRSGILDESRKVLDGMVFKYKRGEVNVQDVLIAQRTYNEVCQDYLETMKGYVSSLVTLERACGMWDIHF